MAVTWTSLGVVVKRETGTFCVASVAHRRHAELATARGVLPNVLALPGRVYTPVRLPWSNRHLLLLLATFCKSGVRVGIFQFIIH